MKSLLVTTTALFAIVIATVHGHQSGRGSIHSHHRLIKRFSLDDISLGEGVDRMRNIFDRRTEIDEDCEDIGSHEWGSSSEWSNENHKHRKVCYNPTGQAYDHQQGDHHHREHRKHPEHKGGHKHQGKTSTTSHGTGTYGGGLFGLTFQGVCSNPNASEEYPNGRIDFLNCNIDHGWKPPHVRIDQLKIASSDEVVKGDVFKNCAKYLGEFKAIEAECHIPATILMSIAMQESHCDGSLIGPNGEVGIMQIIPENCKGNCQNVYNNIHLGAKELEDGLKRSQGNVLQAIGEYNGWTVGMTKGEVRSERYGCFAQQNLDYLHSSLNGWFQGKDGYSKEFLIYNNLGHCH